MIPAANVTLELSKRPLEEEPIMPSAVQEFPKVETQDARRKNLEEIVADYSSPKFTEALMDHFHEAKRRALEDIRNAGLTPATEPETVKS